MPSAEPLFLRDYGFSEQEERMRDLYPAAALSSYPAIVIFGQDLFHAWPRSGATKGSWSLTPDWREKAEKTGRWLILVHFVLLMLVLRWLGRPTFLAIAPFAGANDRWVGPTLLGTATAPREMGN